MVIGLRIPPKAEVLVSTGQNISLSDPLIKLSSQSISHIDVASALRIDPSHIFQHVGVQVGDTIAEGDIIASKKGILNTKHVSTDIPGIVTSIDHVQGTIGVSTDASSLLTHQSCVVGCVDSISEKDQRIYVEIGKADVFSGTSDQDCGGRLVQLTPRDYYSCDEDDVIDGCIHMFSSPTHITSKLEALGARCIMSVEGPESDLPYIRISADDSDKVSHSSKTHVVYSLHDQKVYLYTPKNS